MQRLDKENVNKHFNIRLLIKNGYNQKSDNNGVYNDEN